jgi:hypothetical protein
MKRDYEIDENNEINEKSFGFFVIFVYFVISLHSSIQISNFQLQLLLLNAIYNVVPVINHHTK